MSKVPLSVRIKRAETPFYAFLRRVAHALLYPSLPVPQWLLPAARAGFRLHWIAWNLMRRLYTLFYVTPLFRGRCEQTGKNLYVFCLPQVAGHTRIRLGDDVTIHGAIMVASGRVFDEPVLQIGDNVTMGHQVTFSVNREVVLENNIYIAGRVTIADNDGHPRDPEARRRKEPPPAEEIAPVRICSDVWIGEGCSIRKGVTIGQGAIIGVNSVVLKDVPPYCIAMGSPARVVGFAKSKEQAQNAGMGGESDTTMNL